MNVNKVILVGRLTRDPDVRTTSSGQTVTTVGLATNDFWKDKNGQKQERTEFHNIVLWGRLGEIAGQYLSKGQEAYFEGRIQSRTYTGKDGVEKKSTEVVATNMQLGSRAQGSSYQRPASMAPSPSSAPAQEAPATEQIPTINLDEEQDEVKIEDVPF
jgi:single-strand DNA-binding protein